MKKEKKKMQSVRSTSKAEQPRQARKVPLLLLLQELSQAVEEEVQQITGSKAPPPS